MEKKYISAGTIQKRPYSKQVELVTFDSGNGYHCNFRPECPLSSCPLRNHIDSTISLESR